MSCAPFSAGLAETSDMECDAARLEIDFWEMGLKQSN